MTDISDGTLEHDDGRGDRNVQVAARFENVSKRFGETQALDAVTFELAVGEVHALVGEMALASRPLSNCWAVFTVRIAEKSPLPDVRYRWTARLKR